MQTWFTSDTHFGHANIIKYCNRPFSSVQHMDEALIANWNARVQPDDTIYHLGDFTFFKAELALQYLKRLNGHIHFVKGNHDNAGAAKIAPSFASFHNCYLEIRVKDQDITLCHYALRVWNKSHRGAWHFYGHSHGTLPDDPNSLSFDVGVDCHNYAPISFEEAKARMAKKSYQPIDHHGSR